MLQEQVSEYLGVTSFKRKYPGKTEVKLVQGYLGILFLRNTIKCMI